MKGTGKPEAELLALSHTLHHNIISMKYIKNSELIPDSKIKKLTIKFLDTLYMYTLINLQLVKNPKLINHILDRRYIPKPHTCNGELE